LSPSLRPVVRQSYGTWSSVKDWHSASGFQSSTTRCSTCSTTGGMNVVGSRTVFSKCLTCDARSTTPLLGVPGLTSVSLFSFSRFGLAGLIATVLPFALTPLLQRIGSSWTLLAYAAVVVYTPDPSSTHVHTLANLSCRQFVIVGPALFFLRAPERPNDAPTPTPTKLDRSVFLRTCFTAMSLSNLFQGLVFYFPPVFLPSKPCFFNTSPCHSTFSNTHKSSPPQSASPPSKVPSFCPSPTSPPQ